MRNMVFSKNTGIDHTLVLVTHTVGKAISPQYSFQDILAFFVAFPSEAHTPLLPAVYFANSD